MNVLHINTSASSGGAAIAARRHCEAMRKAGINAQLLSLYGNEDNFTIISDYNQEYKQKREKLGWITHKINRLQIKRVAWHWVYGDYDISNLQVVKDADIIYLHWINEFLGYKTIKNLLEKGKPIIWYMHDMWPITGGCHHSFGCTKYEKDCSNCPLMKFFRNRTKNVLAKKIKYWKRYPNFIPVAPSTWLTECIRHSALFSDKRTYTIPNVIDTNLYIPKEKKGIKEKLGLPLNKKLILASAMGYDNPFKGVQYLVKAMEALSDTNYEFVIVGKAKPEFFPKILHKKLHLLGYIENQSEMVNIYNCAEALLITSMAENFPNVVIEAMSCGMPVIGFATGGIKDQINHKENGWLVKQKDVKGLVEGIHWVLEEANYNDLQKNARQYVLNNCSYHKVLTIHQPILSMCSQEIQF